MFTKKIPIECQKNSQKKLLTPKEKYEKEGLLKKIHMIQQSNSMKLKSESHISGIK